MVSQALNRTLGQLGVNGILNVGGTVKVYGARTLASDPQSDSEWVYVQVRRLINYLRESIDEGTAWVASAERSDAQVWAQVKSAVTTFLTAAWQSGLLVGATAAQAFYVRCDATTNPAPVIQAGQVVTEIGVAAVRPSEFVVFQVTQTTGSSS